MTFPYFKNALKLIWSQKICFQRKVKIRGSSTVTSADNEDEWKAVQPEAIFVLFLCLRNVNENSSILMKVCLDIADKNTAAIANIL